MQNVTWLGFTLVRVAKRQDPEQLAKLGSASYSGKAIGINIFSRCQM